MNNSMAFDILAYAKKLKEAGFTDIQAEVQAEALIAVIDHNLATKRDIMLLKKEMTLGQDNLKKEIEFFYSTLKRDMRELEKDLTIKMGGMTVLIISILGALIKLF